MREMKLTYNPLISEHVDIDGVPYVQACFCPEGTDESYIREALRSVDDLIAPHGLELRASEEESGEYIWMQVTDRENPAVRRNAAYGILHGEIEMKPFSDTDHDAFGGASDMACIGSFEFDAGDCKTWSCLNGEWVVIADDHVELHGFSKDGDDNAIMMLEMESDELGHSLAYIKNFMKKQMGPCDLLALGFKCTYMSNISKVGGDNNG